MMASILHFAVYHSMPSPSNMEFSCFKETFSPRNCKVADVNHQEIGRMETIRCQFFRVLSCHVPGILHKHKIAKIWETRKAHVSKPVFFLLFKDCRKQLTTVFPPRNSFSPTTLLTLTHWSKLKSTVWNCYEIE